MNLLEVGGILDLIDSAIEVEKLLKPLAMSTGSVTRASPMRMESGGGVFGGFVQMILRTPSQIFCMLLEC